MPKSHTILLAEDVDADAHLTRLAFSEADCKVNLLHVPDGQAAMDFLRRQGPYNDAPRPDLILLDLNMPRMDGREFLRKVKMNDEFSSIPIIVLTTSVAERDISASYRGGAAGYISKPNDMDQFVEAIRRLQNYWLDLVHLPTQ